MSDATITPNGKVVPATGNAQRREAMLPSPCVQNHAANMLALPDGDVLCAWFGGTQEGIADISIYLSRLGAGGDCWTAAGNSAFWGAPRAPMTLAISADGGKSWPWQRNLEEGDGYCMTNNSQHKLNREFSYPSIKQGIHGELHIAFTYHRQAIKYACVDEEWVTRSGLER